MADEALRGWGAAADHDGGDVPALAAGVAGGRVVSQHGFPGVDRLVLRHGHRPAHLVLRDGREYAEGPVALPESVRGRRLLR